MNSFVYRRGLARVLPILLYIGGVVVVVVVVVLVSLGVVARYVHNLSVGCAEGSHTVAVATGVGRDIGPTTGGTSRREGSTRGKMGTV